jgi:hypothetical protein
MIKAKGTVRPKSLIILCAVANAAVELDLPEMLITSGNDGTHMKGSRHFSGDALDVRSKHLTDQQLTALVRVVRRRLGTGYQVLVEHRKQANEHLHVEKDG